MKVQVEKMKKDQPKSLCLGIMDSMDKLISGFYGRYSRSRIGSAIADTGWNFCDGAVQFELMRYAKKYLRNHVFTPHAISQHMDINGRPCNYQAYMVLRDVELESNDPLLDKRRDAYLLPNEKKVRWASKN